MEVSSHALYMDRVKDFKYDYVVFTNLTADHLLLHKTMENYKPNMFQLQCLKALEIQMKGLPLVDALFSEVNPIPVKKALNLMGMEVGPLRMPLTEMEEEHAKKLAEEMNVPLLGQIPIVQSICESGDKGTPVALDENTVTGRAFLQLAASVVRQVDKRNVEMAPTEVVKIQK